MAKDFLFEVKIETYFLVSYFLKLGYMIVNWMCLFVYLKYTFASTYLFQFLSIITYNTSF